MPTKFDTSRGSGKPTSVRHRLFARFYPRIAAYADAHGGREHRRELLAETSGRVLEIGAGNGGNFRHYPATVEQVIAVEPEPGLRRSAELAAAGATVPVQVIDGRAEALPVSDRSVDAVVLSLVLCSIADVPAALAEAARVLRPGAHLYFYEHVRSEHPGFARKQRRLDLVWPLLAGGCHLTRDSEQAIAEAGFTIEHARRFDFLLDGRRTPVSPSVIGVATRK